MTDTDNKRQNKKARKKTGPTEKEILAQRKAERKAKEAAFRATIVDGYVMDKNGKPLRRYTLIERLLDNKLFSYGIAVGFLVICMLLVFFLSGSNVFGLPE